MTGVFSGGLVISRYKEKVLRPLVWAGYVFGAIGFALWYRYFGYGSSIATLEGLQIIAAVGIGLSMQPPLIACQAAMPLKEVASITAVFSLARPLGCAIGQFAFGFSLSCIARIHLEMSQVLACSKLSSTPVSGPDFPRSQGMVQSSRHRPVYKVTPRFTIYLIPRPKSQF